MYDTAGFKFDLTRADRRYKRRSIVLVLLLGLGLSVQQPAASAVVERATTTRAAKALLRCGWFENPTPANASLTDRDGTWTIGIQGGHQAEGDWPDFSASRWVRTNNHYGYGCACLRVIADKDEHQVIRIVSGQSRPLQVCRRDRTLTEPKSQD